MPETGVLSDTKKLQLAEFRTTPSESMRRVLPLSLFLSVFSLLRLVLIQEKLGGVPVHMQLTYVFYLNCTRTATPTLPFLYLLDLRRRGCFSGERRPLFVFKANVVKFIKAGGGGTLQRRHASLDLAVLGRAVSPMSVGKASEAC